MEYSEDFHNSTTYQRFYPDGTSEPLEILHFGSGIRYGSRSDPTPRQYHEFIPGYLMPKPYIREDGEHHSIIGGAYTIDYEGLWRDEYSNTVINRDVHQIVDGKPWPGENHLNKAIIEALLNLKEFNKEASLGLMLAESRRTSTLVTSAALTLVRSLALLKKGRIREAGSTLEGWTKTAKAIGSNLAKTPRLKVSHRLPRYQKVKPDDVPNRWLELQYGWKPVIMDVQAAAHALKGMHPAQMVVSCRGKSYDYSTNVMGSYSDINHGIAWLDTVLEGVTVRLDYMPNNDFLTQLNSLGLVNTASIAWELTPLSFVADWVIPIGDWLSACDAVLGYDFVSGSHTKIGRIERHARTDSTLQGEPYFPWDPVPRLAGDLSGYAYWFKMEREVFSESPLPLPYISQPFKLQDGKGMFREGGLTRLANALSLLAAMFKGGSSIR